MIENITLNDFDIVSNFVLIRMDPNYDFIELKGPNGTKVELQLIDPTTKDNTHNIAISGTILKAPGALLYHSELKEHQKGITMASDEFESLMRETMPWDTTLDVKPGDKVIFNYKVGIAAEEEGRLFKDEIGYCILARYETLFAKKEGDMLIPLNGWVFFIRDQKPHEYQTPSGLWVFEKTDKYGVLRATVTASDKRIASYMDKGYYDPYTEMKAGDRIIVQPKWGYRIAHELTAGDLGFTEAVHRKNILCKVNEQAKTVGEYFVL